MSKYKKAASLFLFLEDQMHHFPSVYFHATDLLKLNTLVEKYTEILIFNLLLLCIYYLISAVHTATLKIIV